MCGTCSAHCREIPTGVECLKIRDQLSFCDNVRGFVCMLVKEGFAVSGDTKLLLFCPPLIYGAKDPPLPAGAACIERNLAKYFVPGRTFKHLTNVYCFGAYPSV
jgi:hypothetical protein